MFSGASLNCAAAGVRFCLEWVSVRLVGITDILTANARYQIRWISISLE